MNLFSYGLILPKKTPGQENKQKTSTFNVFGDESDEVNI